MAHYTKPHVVVSSRGLQHCGEESIGKGEAGEPQQSGGLGRLCPACKLIDSLAKVPGPRCQGLQRGVRLACTETEIILCVQLMKETAQQLVVTLSSRVTLLLQQTGKD